MEHLGKHHRHLAYGPNGTVHARPVAVPRHKVLCNSYDCGHPRSEHHSAFDRESNDYKYGKCTVPGCPCSTFVETEEVEVSAEKEGTDVGAHPNKVRRCQACGVDAHMHVFLGDECLKNCEDNWRELGALKAMLEAVRTDHHR